MKNKELKKQRHPFRLVFFINLTFTIIELIGGFLTNSVAIWADAIHDLGDTLSIGLSWRFESVSKRERDTSFSFGYRRFSLIGALVNGSVLTLGSLAVLTQSIPRIFNPQTVDAEGMFGLAILGILANGFAAFKLRGKKSISEGMLSLHLLEDILGWVLVLVASVAIYFGDFHILDPILSIFLSIFILYNAFKRLKKTVLILLQSIPPDMNLKNIEACVCGFENVLGVHDTHIWSLDGSFHVLSMHVTINKDTTREQALKLKCLIKETLKKQGIEHSTLEVEFEDEKCPNL